MKYLLLSTLILGIGCKNVNNTTINKPAPESSNSAQESLEGFYLLPDGGSIELVQLENGSYVIYGTQRIVSDNADSSSSLHPNLPTTALLAVNGKLIGNYSATYAASNIVKRDSDNTVITGSRLTSYELKIGSNGKLNIVLKVYAANNIDVETSRTVVEE